MRALAPFLIAAAVLTMGASAGPPAWLVDHVRAEINDGYDPNDPEGPPLSQPSPRMFKRVDINGDGIADWRVDYEGEIGWCGTGGCRMALWLGRPDGALTPVFDTQVREFRLKARKTGAVLDVDFHGSACGGAGVIPCPRRYVWDSSLGAFMPAVNKKGDGFIAGVPVPPMDLGLEDVPADIKAEALAMADLCRQAGGQVDDSGYPLARLPDLNGDGAPDWALGSEFDPCQDPADPSLRPLALEIQVSGPDGHFHIAWGSMEPQIAFDVSKTPAVLLQLVTDGNACGIESAAACPRKPLRWDEATRKLVPSA